MRIVALTGGGTAGHVMPAVAVGQSLRKLGFGVIFIGAGGMEKEIAAHYKFKFFETEAAKFHRGFSAENLKIPFVLRRAEKQAKDILSEHRVTAVFAKGGYVSLPTCLAARAMKIPVINHESDYSMGLSNKLIARFARKTLTSFPETPGGIFTGNPIREELFSGNAERARKKYGLGDGKTILIFGGSQGSLRINKCVYEAVKGLTNLGEIVHIVGKNASDPPRRKGYTAIPYADDIADLYAAAHTVVIRGGANSLAEAHALGKRIVVIPLPKSRSSRGDQVENAKSYRSRGFCSVIDESDLSATELIRAVSRELNKSTNAPVDEGVADKIARIVAAVVSETVTRL